MNAVMSETRAGIMIVGLVGGREMNCPISAPVKPVCTVSAANLKADVKHQFAGSAICHLKIRLNVAKVVIVLRLNAAVRWLTARKATAPGSI